MKPLALLKVAAAAAIVLSSTSFKPVRHHPKAKKDTQYYWYVDGLSVYDGWYSINTEILRLEEEYDQEVDEDPLLGTLVAGGYFVKGYPHTVYASALLYTH